MMDRRDYDIYDAEKGLIPDGKSINYEKVKDFEYVKFHIDELACATIECHYKIFYYYKHPRKLLFDVLYKEEKYKYEVDFEDGRVHCTSDDGESVVETSILRIIDKFIVDEGVNKDG